MVVKLTFHYLKSIKKKNNYQLFSKKLIYIAYIIDVVIFIKTDEFPISNDWMEYHADKYATFIFMPKKFVVKLFKDLHPLVNVNTITELIDNT